MKIVNDETGAVFPLEQEVRHIQDLGAYIKTALKAREENFKRLGIKS